MQQQLLSVTQVADHLSVSERYIRALIARRELPIVRIGRHTLIEPEALAQFVEAHGSGSQAPSRPMDGER
jgi:excisionase family DNA binding protein